MKASEWAGRNLKTLRRRADDMSAEVFGRLMGELGYPMSRQTVWKIEKGQRPLTVDELFAAAYVLGTSPLSLFEPQDDQAIDVGDGVSLDEKAFGDWWLHISHPRPDVPDEQMDRVRPSPVEAFYSDVMAAITEANHWKGVVELIAAGLQDLPEDVLAAMRDAKDQIDSAEGDE